MPVCLPLAAVGPVPVRQWFFYSVRVQQKVHIGDFVREKKVRSMNILRFLQSELRRPSFKGVLCKSLTRPCVYICTIHFCDSSMRVSRPSECISSAAHYSPFALLSFLELSEGIRGSKSDRRWHGHTGEGAGKLSTFPLRRVLLLQR